MVRHRALHGAADKRTTTMKTSRIALFAAAVCIAALMARLRIPPLPSI